MTNELPKEVSQKAGMSVYSSDSIKECVCVCVCVCGVYVCVLALLIIQIVFTPPFLSHLLEAISDHPSHQRTLFLSSPASLLSVIHFGHRLHHLLPSSPLTVLLSLHFVVGPSCVSSSCIRSLGYHNTVTPTKWLKTTEIYSGG